MTVAMMATMSPVRRARKGRSRIYLLMQTVLVNGCQGTSCRQVRQHRGEEAVTGPGLACIPTATAAAVAVAVAASAVAASAVAASAVAASAAAVGVAQVARTSVGRGQEERQGPTLRTRRGRHCAGGGGRTV